MAKKVCTRCDEEFETTSDGGMRGKCVFKILQKLIGKGA